jgi:hypothetical protein
MGGGCCGGGVAGMGMIWIGLDKSKERLDLELKAFSLSMTMLVSRR